MAKFLTTKQIGQYLQDGVVSALSVLSPAEVERYRGACDELERDLGGKPRTIDVRQMHLHFPWAWELAQHSRILDAAEDILGPDLLIWATELFSKHAHDGKLSIGWHRDRPYMGFAPEQTTTAWVALSPSSADNGCMCVLPRSCDRLDGAVRTPGVDMPTDNIYPVVLKPGEMSLHDSDILHGSAPNTSGEKRVGFVIRFVTPQARPLFGRPPAVLARGCDTHNHFELVEQPPAAPLPAALARLSTSATQHLDTVLENLRHTREVPGSRTKP